MGQLPVSRLIGTWQPGLTVRAFGNVVGSTIYNVLAIVGVSGLVARDGIAVAPAVLTFDLPVALAACVAGWPVFLTGHAIARWEGALFLGYYVAYVMYLVMEAQQHDALGKSSAVMLWFVIPLTVVTFAVVTARASGILEKRKQP